MVYLGSDQTQWRGRGGTSWTASSFKQLFLGILVTPIGGGLRVSFRVPTPFPRMFETHAFKAIMLLFLAHNSWGMHMKPNLEKAQCDR